MASGPTWALLRGPLGRPRDRASILVTHHLEEIPVTATHAALLRAGTAVAAGPIEVVLTDEHVSACFDIPVSVSSVQGRWHGQADRAPASG